MQDAPKGDILRTDDAERGSNSITRRTWLNGAATVMCAGATIMMAQRAVAQQKTPQAAAKYQTSPKGSAQCSSCMQFQAPSSCKLVDGTISPNGWCMLYTPKAHG